MEYSELDINIIKSFNYYNGVWDTFTYLKEELGMDLFNSDLAKEAKLELGL